MRALITEDNELQSKLLQELLKEENISSTIAMDGKEGLNLLETDQFDVIISDVYMSEMDGLVFLNIVKKDEKFKNIPFVMYSSKPIESDMELAYRLKVDKFVPEAGLRGIVPAVLKLLNLKV